MDSERALAAISTIEKLCIARYNTRELPEGLANPIAAARAEDADVSAAARALIAEIDARGTMYHWEGPTREAIAELTAALADDSVAVPTDAEAVVEGNVGEATARIAVIEDSDLLRAAWDVESAGKNRVTLLDALTERITVLEEPPATT